LQKTREDAWNDALDKARREVVTWLGNQVPLADWEPTLDYVQKQLIKGEPVEKEDFHDPLIGSMRKIQLTVEVSTRDRDDLLRLVRRHCARQRMQMLAKALSGLVILLGTFASYVRLDEWTKGYYTNRLRLGAMGLVAAAGTGFYLLA
jgi:hypothetical protein